MGRPPKPTKLHVLTGTGKKNPQRLKNRGAEPEVEEGVGQPPEWLPEYAMAEWHRCAEHPVIGQLLRANHRTSFEHYCLLYHRFVLDAKGVEVMKASDRQSFHSLCMQLGFTPASQARVSMPAEKKPESVWDKIASR